MATTNQTTIEMQENPMPENSVLSKAEKKEKRRLSQIMMEYDVDNNGEFSKEEVIRIVRDMDFIKVKAKRFECLAIVLVVALVLLVCAMFGIVYLGNEVSKESHVSDNGVLTSASTGKDLVCQDQHTIKSAKKVDGSRRRLHRGFGRQLAGVSLGSVDCLDVYAAYTSGKKSGEVSFVSATKVAGFTVTSTLTGRADTFLESDTALMSTEMKLTYPVTRQTYNVECVLESGKCKSDVQCIVSGHSDISTSNSNETRRLLITNNRRHLGAGSEQPILADDHYITNRDVDQVTDHKCIAYHCFHGDPLCHYPVDKQTHTEQETGRPLCHVRRRLSVCEGIGNQATCQSTDFDATAKLYCEWRPASSNPYKGPYCSNPCHPSHSTVNVRHSCDAGTCVSLRRMDELEVGDMAESTPGMFEPILGFSHKSKRNAIYLQLHTNKTTLNISPDHMVYVNGKRIPAKQAKPFDMLNDGERIEWITAKKMVGIYHPETWSTKLIVDGIQTSTIVRTELSSEFTTEHIINPLFYVFYIANIPVEYTDEAYARKTIVKDAYISLGDSLKNFGIFGTVLHTLLWVPFGMSTFIVAFPVTSLKIISVGLAAYKCKTNTHISPEILTTSATVVGVGFLVSASKIKSE